jgi:hypothetical protein
MSDSTLPSSLGRYVFGAAAFALGVITLVWHDYSGSLPHFVYVAAIAEIFGGAAIQFRASAKVGAAVLSVVYLFFVLLCVPRIIAAPQTYIPWGDFFEQFSLVTGAAIAYACLSSAWTPATVNRIGCILFGICTFSFGVEQELYLGKTASLVPHWIPPSQTFWAIATASAFALAAVALLTNIKTLLASRLLTLMLIIFGLVVWVPMILAGPHSHTNWSEGAETFAIAGAVWILADLLRVAPQ